MKKVTKDMTLGDIVSTVPEAGEILMRYGLHCIGCHAARHETLEMGARAHGMDYDQIEDMVKELNKKLEPDSKGE